MLRRRLAVLAACAAVASGGLALAASTPASADPAPGSLTGDYSPPPPPPPAPPGADAPAPALGPGYATFDAGSGWTFRNQRSYTLRLVANSQGNVETMRAAAQAAAAQLDTISGVTITVASGTVADSSPDREPAEDEVLLSIDSSSGCAGSGWAGCAGPRRIDYANDAGVATIQAGRIWIHPVVVGYSTADRNHVVAHELGHVLGLDHFNSSYGGSLQVMNGEAAGYAAGAAYRSGDQNGLRFLRPTPCRATYKAPQRKLVKAAYADFEGRAPTSDELLWWTTALSSGAACRLDLIDFVADSDDHLGSLVEQGYQRVFSRSADPGGRTFWIGKLRSGEYSYGRFVAYSFSGSEFWVDAGSTNGGYVDALYPRIFGRAPDPAGRTYWVGRLDSGSSRYTVASSLFASGESRGDRVDIVSNRILGRTLDASGRDYWSDELAGNGGDEVDISVRLAMSSEYFNRAQTRF